MEGEDCMHGWALDVIVPVFNEAELLRDFHARLSAALATLPARVRFLYVNDGSTDGTGTVLRELARRDPGIVVIELVRNFGHQAALAAGLDHADADAVIMMDGDGQHPPELIPEMVKLWEKGYEVVQAQRLDDPGKLSFKQATARAFYWLASRIGELPLVQGGADFRLISRPVLLALGQLREYHRFYRGLIPWLGFRTAIVPFRPQPRLAGKTKYSLRKMLKLAGAGLFSFSLLPLKVGIFFGALFVLLAVLELAYIAGLWLSGRQHLLVPGWSSIIVLLTLGLGALMLLIGFVGIYVGMIFQEVKERPVYVVRAVIGKGTETTQN